MKDLLNYNLPLALYNLPEGVTLFNKKIHSKSIRYVAHAHFLKGLNVYDSNCKDCVGVLKS